MAILKYQCSSYGMYYQDYPLVNKHGWLKIFFLSWLTFQPLIAVETLGPLGPNFHAMRNGTNLSILALSSTMGTGFPESYQINLYTFGDL